MKKESPLWSSISLLIGIVIAILALIRGRMLLPLLLAVFALWLLWWLLTQALPLWRNNRAYAKVKNGTQLSEAMGLGAIMAQCPHFKKWIEDMVAW